MTDVFYVVSDLDIVPLRQRARELATRMGLPVAAVEGVATALTEVARNIVVHARGTGIVSLSIEKGPQGDEALLIVARDRGPGIEDVERALKDGYSTAGSLGLGLPGARRLVDDLHITTAAGVGTTVTMRKWRRQR